MAVADLFVLVVVLGICRLFSVGRTSYYDWLKRKDKPDLDLAILDLIIRIRQIKQSLTMGHRKITKFIQDEYFFRTIIKRSTVS